MPLATSDVQRVYTLCAHCVQAINEHGRNKEEA